MTRENADLKDRIVMCRDEYKILYKEKGKLQKKYEHYKGKRITCLSYIYVIFCV